MKQLAIEGVDDDRLATAIKAGIYVSPIKLMPFEHTLSQQDFAYIAAKPTVVLGSTHIIDAMRKGLFPDTAVIHWEEDALSYKKVPEKLSDYFLNSKGRIGSLQADLDNRSGFQRFIKPVSDLKTFGGLVVQAGQTLREALDRVQLDFVPGAEDFPIYIGPIRKIESEFRVFVVGGKVVSISRYRLRGQLLYTRVRPDSHIAEVLGELALLEKPLPAYVCDIAEVPGGKFQIIEYNCINCAGFYAADGQAILKALCKLE